MIMLHLWEPKLSAFPLINLGLCLQVNAAYIPSAPRLPSSILCLEGATKQGQDNSNSCSYNVDLYYIENETKLCC